MYSSLLVDDGRASTVDAGSLNSRPSPRSRRAPATPTPSPPSRRWGRHRL